MALVTALICSAHAEKECWPNAVIDIAKHHGGRVLMSGFAMN
jgi:hypothetical protein